jgi:hypothetical protein
MLLHERLRQRKSQPAFTPAIESLGAAALRLKLPGVCVPAAGIAGWNHDYFCPQHHAPLEFDLANPNAHRCSFGGETFTGAIYDAAWWRKMNLLLAEGALAGAILYVSGESERLESVRKVLNDYAQVYPTYAVHGTIPHNGPGRANAQTLDEAGWIITLATTFDLVQTALSQSECENIKQRLFHECGLFLIEHGERQLHNHQCWIAAAIGVIGLVLSNPEWVRHALYDRWGMIDQLDRGVLSEGLWCELTPTYHFYAFDALSRFARFESDMVRSVREHPAFRQMPLAGLRLLLPDNSFPLLNDTTPPLGLRDLAQGGYGLSYIASRLEIASAWWPDPVLTWALHQCYQDHPRTSIEALCYGPDDIPAAHRPAFLKADYLTRAAGIALLRRPRREIAYVMLKNTPDGGEHDHRDRPGLYIGLSEEERFAPDLGTVPYGLPLHYGWFKTTQGHNTVVVEGAMQPPPSQLWMGTRTLDERTLIAAHVGWDQADSPYCGVRFKRRTLVMEGQIEDVFKVRAPHPIKLDYLFHFTSTPDSDALTCLVQTDLMLYPYFERVYQVPGHLTSIRWSDRLILRFGSASEDRFIACAPDNPFQSRPPLWVFVARTFAVNHIFQFILEFDGKDIRMNPA